MKQLNYIARLIIESFTEKGLDSIYIKDKKIEMLRHSNKFQTLAYASNLDAGHTRNLADKLGCSYTDLKATINFIGRYV